jgi:hypothetical protein
MINRVTGEVSFRNDLHIVPHRAITSPHRSRALSLKGWKWHLLGVQPSEHGTFEVEALSEENDCILLVMLSHQHPFYEKDTPMDADRRAFHEGVISRDLGGQREFWWGEVICRFETILNSDWLIVAYKRDANVPLPEKEVLLQLLAHEKIPE